MIHEDMERIADGIDELRKIALHRAERVAYERIRGNLTAQSLDDLVTAIEQLTTARHRYLAA